MSKPGRPRTTGSKSTAHIQFRVGTMERAAADREARRRGLRGANELARLALLAALRSDPEPTT